MVDETGHESKPLHRCQDHTHGICIYDSLPLGKSAIKHVLGTGFFAFWTILNPSPSSLRLAGGVDALSYSEMRSMDVRGLGSGSDLNPLVDVSSRSVDRVESNTTGGDPLGCLPERYP